MKTFIILNKNAGTIQKASDLIEACSKSKDIQILQSSAPDEFQEAISRAISEGFEMIVAGGGDGTVHTVANALVGYSDRVCMGILPLGTGNDLCRTLMVPQDPLEALSLILSKNEIKVDLLKVTSGQKSVHCVNLISGGLGGEVEKIVDGELKEQWGPLTYLRGAISASQQM